MTIESEITSFLAKGGRIKKYRASERAIEPGMFDVSGASTKPWKLRGKKSALRNFAVKPAGPVSYDR